MTRTRILSAFTGMSLLALTLAGITISLSGQVSDFGRVELAMEQELRAVEVSIWKSVHAADAYRATSDPKYSALYFEQLAAVGQAFQAYSRLTDTPYESAGSEGFRQNWHRATDAGRFLMTTVRDGQDREDQLRPTGSSQNERAAAAFGTFLAAVNNTASVLDEHLHGYIGARMQARANAARLKRFAAGAAAFLALLGLSLFSLLLSRPTAAAESGDALAEAENEIEAQAAASKARAEFLASVAQEIRAPLNGLIGMAELLGTTAVDTVQRELVVDIHHSADALLDVINDVLDFSSIDTGQFEPESEPFDLEAIAHEVCRLLAHSTEAKNLELILEYQANCPRAFVGDSGRLRQILVNLMGNGLKFTGDGYVLLEVSCSSVTDDLATVSLAIRDTGICADSRPFGGTGLGRALMKQMVEVMGGSVRLESTAGGGSTLRVELPLRTQEVTESEEVDTPRDLAVLLVGSHAVNREVLGRSLAALGLRVEAVSDQFEAMRSLTAAISEGRRYHVLVVDEPTSNHGARLLGAVLENPLFGDMPVISVVSPRRADVLNDPRVASYVSKPILSSELRAAVQASVGAGSASTMAPPREKAIEGRQPADRPTRSAHILVVEDNPVNQMLASMLLKKLGHEVSTAVDGKKAVEFLAESSVDLVFMDCQMPVMDGYAATRAIRQNEVETEGHLPILALTANASPSNRQACLDSGMDDFLTKPCSSGDFEKALELWLSPTEQAPSASRFSVPGNTGSAVRGAMRRDGSGARPEGGAARPA